MPIDIRFISEWVELKGDAATSVACRWGQEIEKKNNNKYLCSLWSKRWNVASIGSFKLLNISICTQGTYISIFNEIFNAMHLKNISLHDRLNCALGEMLIGRCTEWKTKTHSISITLRPVFVKCTKIKPGYTAKINIDCTVAAQLTKSSHQQVYIVCLVLFFPHIYPSYMRIANVFMQPII